MPSSLLASIGCLSVTWVILRTARDTLPCADMLFRVRYGVSGTLVSQELLSQELCPRNSGTLCEQPMVAGSDDGGHGHSLGGCQPTATHACLARTRVGRLRWRALTVARPVGVAPMIKHPSSDQRKCSCQSWCRGLNNLTTSPLAASSNAIRQPLESLHSEQASQRLSSSVMPPRASGIR